jgi:hypothetical protein
MHPPAGAMPAAQPAGTALRDTIASQAKAEPEVVSVLAKLERMNKAASGKIDRLAAAVVSKAPKEAAKRTTADEMRGAFDKAAVKLRTLSQDPEKLQGAIIKATDDIYDHAPRVAEAVGMASTRAVTYLAGKLPQPPQTGPLAMKWEPSMDQIATFDRYKAAVDDPTIILRHAADGTLVQQEVDAVRAVHPELLQAISVALLAQITKHGVESVPYRSRLMLSLLLGQDMDGSLSIPSLVHAAHGFKPKPMMPGPKAKGSHKMGFSDRMAPATSAAAGRM